MLICIIVYSIIDVLRVELMGGGWNPVIVFFYAQFRNLPKQIGKGSRFGGPGGQGVGVYFLCTCMVVFNTANPIYSALCRKTTSISIYAAKILHRSQLLSIIRRNMAHHDDDDDDEDSTEWKLLLYKKRKSGPALHFNHSKVSFSPPMLCYFHIAGRYYSTNSSPCYIWIFFSWKVAWIFGGKVSQKFRETEFSWKLMTRLDSVFFEISPKNLENSVFFEKLMKAVQNHWLDK